MVLVPVPLSDLIDQIAKAVKAEIERDATPRVDSEGLLSRQEAAELLHITLPTLRAHTVGGRLRSYRIGARVLYKRSELIQATANQ